MNFQVPVTYEKCNLTTKDVIIYCPVRLPPMSRGGDEHGAVIGW
jgi:hypothetical protein